MSLSDADYAFVRDLTARESALALGADKAYLVEARLAPLAEREGCESVGDLLTGMRTGTRTSRTPLAVLRDEVVQAMTTNETSFFRDGHPFDALRDVVLPEALARRGRVAVWSAAASTGQEAYSVAMLAADHFPDRAVSVLATDLSRDVLARAQAGQYSQLEVNRGLPAALLVRHFTRVGTAWQVSDDLRRRVEFRALNLARPWPPLPPMDVVLLRNVLIYFDEAAKRAVLAQVAGVLAPGGVLFLGGAETTYGLDSSWERVQVGRTSFYRPARPDEGHR